MRFFIVIVRTGLFFVSRTSRPVAPGSNHAAFQCCDVAMSCSFQASHYINCKDRWCFKHNCNSSSGTNNRKNEICKSILNYIFSTNQLDFGFLNCCLFVLRWLFYSSSWPLLKSTPHLHPSSSVYPVTSYTNHSFSIDWLLQFDPSGGSGAGFGTGNAGLFGASGTGLGVSNAYNGGISSSQGSGFGSSNPFLGYNAGGNGFSNSFGK